MDTCPADEFRTAGAGCSESDLPEIKQRCSRLSEAPFDTCGIEVAQQIDACRYDLCFTEKAQWDLVICDYLDDHERNCLAAGWEVEEWRTEFFCPVACPDSKMKFSRNATSCFKTTANCHESEVEVCVEEDRCVCPDDLPI